MVYRELKKEQNATNLRANRYVYVEKQINQTCKNANSLTAKEKLVSKLADWIVQFIVIFIQQIVS